MNAWFGRHVGIKKAISAAVALAFCVSFVLSDAWAVSERISRPNLPSQTSESQYANLEVNTFTIPSHLGEIKYSFKGDSDKIVIHIQDAHCNYFAQKKVSEIIEYLNIEYGLKVVNLEGGVGEYDLNVFTSIQDPILRKEVSGYFVKKGEINGAELYAINNPDDVELWGIEDEELYIENLQVYKNSLKYKAQVDAWLDELTHVMNDLKRHIYGPQLLKIDMAYSAYKAGNTSFRDYLSFLIKAAAERKIPTQQFTNLSMLSEAMEMESGIDFNKAERERNVLIDELKSNMSMNEIKELIAKSIDFKTKKISRNAFYGYLLRKARARGINIEQFPALSGYIAYVTAYGSVDRYRVMEELDKLEYTIKETLYQNNEQRELNALSRHLALLKNIFGISLIRTDYMYYRENPDVFSVSNFIKFIEREAPKYKVTTRLDPEIVQLDTLLERIIKFYDYSFKRDEVFLKNMQFSSVSGDTEGAILMTGGFHTENLYELFKGSGISYVSIFPKFTSEKGYESTYFELLSGESGGIQFMLEPIAAKAAMLQIASKLTRLGKRVNPTGVVSLNAAVTLLKELASRDDWKEISGKIDDMEITEEDGLVVCRLGGENLASMPISDLFVIERGEVIEVPNIVQLEALKQLLQNKQAAREMAEWQDGAYYRGIGEEPPEFISPEEEGTDDAKEKIAINLAGIYAVESGIGVICERDNNAPLEVLRGIIAHKNGEKLAMSEKDMLLLARFANVAWKAGQPFRSLDRLERDTFRPAGLLKQEELKKDYVQVYAAAEQLETRLSSIIEEGISAEERRDLEAGVEGVINLVKERRDLTQEEERGIREAAQTVMFAHQNQRRRGGAPYFTHQLAVVKTLIETFGVTDPVMLQISLLHDTREDQEKFYDDFRDYVREVISRIDVPEAASLAGERFNEVRLGVRMLSKLTGEKYEELFPEEDERDREYYRRLVNPRGAYAPRPGQEGWYNDDFVHNIQLIKLADRMANLDDLQDIFEGEEEVSEGDQNFPKKTFDKTFDVLIPELLENPESQITERERELFYNSFDKSLRDYMALRGSNLEERAQPLILASLEAFTRLAVDHVSAVGIFTIAKGNLLLGLFIGLEVLFTPLILKFGQLPVLANSPIGTAFIYSAVLSGFIVAGIMMTIQTVRTWKEGTMSSRVGGVAAAALSVLMATYLSFNAIPASKIMSGIKRYYEGPAIAPVERRGEISNVDEIYEKYWASDEYKDRMAIRTYNAGSEKGLKDAQRVLLDLALGENGVNIMPAYRADPERWKTDPEYRRRQYRDIWRSVRARFYSANKTQKGRDDFVKKGYKATVTVASIGRNWQYSCTLRTEEIMGKTVKGKDGKETWQKGYSWYFNRNRPGTASFKGIEDIIYNDARDFLREEMPTNMAKEPYFYHSTGIEMPEDWKKVDPKGISDTNAVDPAHIFYPLKAVDLVKDYGVEPKAPGTTTPSAAVGSWFKSLKWIRNAWWAETGISLGIGVVVGLTISTTLMPLAAMMAFWVPHLFFDNKGAVRSLSVIGLSAATYGAAALALANPYGLLAIPVLMLVHRAINLHALRGASTGAVSTRAPSVDLKTRWRVSAAAAVICISTFFGGIFPTLSVIVGGAALVTLTGCEEYSSSDVPLPESTYLDETQAAVIASAIGKGFGSPVSEGEVRDSIWLSNSDAYQGTVASAYEIMESTGLWDKGMRFPVLFLEEAEDIGESGLALMDLSVIVLSKATFERMVGLDPLWLSYMLGHEGQHIINAYEPEKMSRLGDEASANYKMAEIANALGSEFAERYYAGADAFSILVDNSETVSALLGGANFNDIYYLGLAQKGDENNLVGVELYNEANTTQPSIFVEVDRSARSFRALSASEVQALRDSMVSISPSSILPVVPTGLYPDALSFMIASAQDATGRLENFYAAGLGVLGPAMGGRGRKTDLAPGSWFASTSWISKAFIIETGIPLGVAAVMLFFSTPLVAAVLAGALFAAPHFFRYSKGEKKWHMLAAQTSYPVVVGLGVATGIASAATLVNPVLGTIAIGVLMLIHRAVNIRSLKAGYPERFPVPKEMKPWTVEYPGYTAPYFVDISVLDNDSTVKPGGWADPEDIDKARKDRTFRSYEGEVKFDEIGRPLNPRGRTGIEGRGLLGKWGANFAADPIITRANPETGEIEMLAIKRGDTGEWAIPGGMVDEGEMVPETLSREFREEAGIDLDMSDAAEVYRGYVDDPRNTDNAWMETHARHKHLSSDIAAQIHPKEGSDAIGVKWITLEEDKLDQLYADHGKFIRIALARAKAIVSADGDVNLADIGGLQDIVSAELKSEDYRREGSPVDALLKILTDDQSAYNIAKELGKEELTSFFNAVFDGGDSSGRCPLLFGDTERRSIRHMVFFKYVSNF